MKGADPDIRPGQSLELLKELHILTRDGRMNQDSRRKLKQVYHLYQFIEKLLLEVKNPYSGAVTLTDGLPENTAPGHGFGCRSIAAIAQKWGGLCTFRAEEGAFSLQLAIPLA